MEADLQRYYQQDLLDLWRGTLTLRKLKSLLANLPVDAALVRRLNGGPVWDLHHHLLDDLRMAVMMGSEKVDARKVKPSPDRVRAHERATRPRVDPHRQHQIEAARRRARERRRRIAAGEIT